jgi:hypothetical protein
MIITRPLDLIHKLNTYDLFDIVRFYCPIDKEYYYIRGVDYHNKTYQRIIEFDVVDIFFYNEMNYSVLTYREIMRYITHNVADLSLPHSIQIREYDTGRWFDIIQ